MTVAVACEQLARLSTRRAVAANGGSFSSYFIFFLAFFSPALWGRPISDQNSAVKAEEKKKTK